jgi:PAS domain S-box-containing protein
LAFTKDQKAILTLAVFLFSIWSLALYTSNYLRQDMQHMLSDQQFSTVSLLATEVNDELETRLEALEKTSEQIGPVALADPVALQTSLERQPVFQTLFNGGTFVTGMDGVAIVSVPESIGRIGVSYIDRDYILATLREGKTTISKPVIGKKLMAPVFAMATPIHDADGKVIGAFVGVIDLSKHNFIDKITQSHYGKTGGYFLVAPQYRLIVTASDKTRVMQQYPAPGILPTIDRFLEKGYEGGSSVYVNPLGIEVLGSAKTIPVAGWFIGAILPTTEAFAPIRAMQRRIVLTAILMSLFVGGLTWWVLKRLLYPMIAAVRTLVVLSDTDQPLQPLPITSQSEIGELIDGLNRLLNTLAQREKALKESEKKYRTILQTVMDGFWLADQQGRLLEVNEAYCRMSGYNMQELLTMHVSDLEAVDTTAEISARIQRNMTLGEEHERFETLHRRKDGSIFNVEISAQYLPGEGGEGMAFLRDVTELKKTEKEFRLVFEQNQDAIIWADPDIGIIIKVNAKAEELTERTREELIGKNQTHLSPPELEGEGLFRRATTTPDGGVIEGVVFTRSMTPPSGVVVARRNNPSPSSSGGDK